MSSRYKYFLWAMLGIAILASVLYIPFLSSGIIFDDHGLFANGEVYDRAQVIFNLVPRTFPYFTLGFFSVVSDAVEVNRIVSLVLHILCAWMLYLLIYQLLSNTSRTFLSSCSNEEYRHKRIAIFSFVGASWFAIHPIAVYGAGYLVQRTILFATLFSLLSLLFYRRAIAENRTVDIFTAALFYSLAVFSKEHAIMLPVAAVMLTALFEGFRAHIKRVLLYFALCLPAALLVLLATKHIVTTSYEPTIGVMSSPMQDMALADQLWGKWVVSMIFQAGFFFDYLAFWIVPDVRFLSADMRFDFAGIWSSWWVFPKAVLFFLFPLLAIYLLKKRGLIALFFWGFLYCWLLFLTELAAVRFQEPFVLYRSYLWAPGYAMMLVAMCARLSLRWVVAIVVPVFVIFLLLGRERLVSISTEANVWKDAASKLISPTYIGSDRIFYNRGRAYLQEKKYEEAIADFSLAIQQNSQVSQAYYNRALALYGLKQYSEALLDLDQAFLLNPKGGYIQYARGVLFESLGCVGSAASAYSASSLLGEKMAQLKLENLTSKNLVPVGKKQSVSTSECF